MRHAFGRRRDGFVCVARGIARGFTDLRELFLGAKRSVLGGANSFADVGAVAVARCARLRARKFGLGASACILRHLCALRCGIARPFSGFDAFLELTRLLSVFAPLHCTFRLDRLLLLVRGGHQGVFCRMNSVHRVHSRRDFFRRRFLRLRRAFLRQLERHLQICDLSLCRLGARSQRITLTFEHADTRACALQASLHSATRA